MSQRIDQVFAGARYRVPEYQRDYRWDRTNWSQLWLDLHDAVATDVAKRAAASPPEPLFLGAVVVQEASTTSSAMTEIIDGQQRLVTLSVLFAVCREWSSALTDAAARAGWSRTFSERLGEAAGAAVHPRLTLARSQNDYQAIIVDALTQADRQIYVNAQYGRNLRKKSVPGRLLHAAAYFRDAVGIFLGEHSDDIDQWLTVLFETILNVSIALRIEVLDEEIATNVFEVLNARGLALSQADLIKNLVLSRAREEGTEAAVSASWQRARDDVETQDWVTFSDLLQFDFAITNGFVRASKLFVTVRDHLRGGGTSALLYAQRVEQDAAALRLLLEAGSTFTSGEIRRLRYLRLALKNKYAYTLLLAGMRRFSNSPLEREAVLAAAEAFVFRFFHVQEADLATYSRAITDSARALVAGGTVASLKTELRQVCTDPDFQAAFAEYRAGTSALGFYVMAKIEDFESSGAGIQVQPQSPSQHLEHIMPQTPGTDWGHVSGLGGYQDMVWRVGNLLVLEGGINTSIRNFSFETKVDAYQNSALTLPGQLHWYTEGTWDFSGIDARQRDLALHYATAVWPL